MAFRIPKSILLPLSKIYVSKKFPFMMWNPKFHRIKGYEMRQVMNVIKPGDILLRRNEGWLTSKAIPGFWMHAGLYIGNNQVVNALADGVISEDILDFMRTDNIVVLRLTGKLEQNKKAIKKAIEMVSEHIPYDYDFSDKNGKVYCTELINVVYDGIFYDDYKKDFAGGSTLIPDCVYNSDKVQKIIEFRHCA